jgi:hypothetical protein
VQWVSEPAQYSFAVKLGGWTTGSLARADATPFASQHVVVAWGSIRVAAKRLCAFGTATWKCHRLGESRAVFQRAAVIGLGLRQDAGVAEARWERHIGVRYAWHGVEGNTLVS